MWIIHCVFVSGGDAMYGAGGHTVMSNGEPLRFKSKQEAQNYAETLLAATRQVATRNMRTNNVSYMVVEDRI